MSKENTVNPLTRYQLSIEYHIPHGGFNDDIVFRLMVRELLTAFYDRGFDRATVLNDELKRFCNSEMDKAKSASEAI